MGNGIHINIMLQQALDSFLISVFDSKVESRLATRVYLVKLQSRMAQDFLEYIVSIEPVES